MPLTYNASFPLRLARQAPAEISSERVFALELTWEHDYAAALEAYLALDATAASSKRARLHDRLTSFENDHPGAVRCAFSAQVSLLFV